MNSRAHGPTRVVVVGASVAGAVNALRLARAGVSSVVLEQRAQPSDKVCGEGIQPAGRELIAEVLPELEGLGMPFEGFEFVVPGRSPMGWSFPRGVRGLGVERLQLDRSLRDALDADPRIDFRPGVSVRGLERSDDEWVLDLGRAELRTDIVVGADGVRSRVRKMAGLESRRLCGRWGARTRYDAAPPRRVQIFFGEGVEVYVTPLGSRHTSVAILGDEKRLRALDEDGFTRELLALDALPDGPRTGEWKLWPHVGASASIAARAGVFLVGDAALVLDPISGAGMTLAALSGTLAAGEIVAIANGHARERAASRYVRMHRRASRPYKRLTGVLLCLASSPTARWCADRALRSRPEWIEWWARPTFAPPKGIPA